MEIYCGQDRTDDGLPASTEVVLDINNQLLGKGYNIYIWTIGIPALVYLFSYYKQKQTFEAQSGSTVKDASRFFKEKVGTWRNSILFKYWWITGYEMAR